MDKNFDRLLATLGMVSATTPLSTSEIHRRLQVRGLKASPRTVQRDLEALSARFGIECDTRTKPFGWRWPKNRVRLSVPDMEWPEALSFRLLPICRVVRWQLALYRSPAFNGATRPWPSCSRLPNDRYLRH